MLIYHIWMQIQYLRHLFIMVYWKKYPVFFLPVINVIIQVIDCKTRFLETEAGHSRTGFHNHLNVIIIW